LKEAELDEATQALARGLPEDGMLAELEDKHAAEVQAVFDAAGGGSSKSSKSSSGGGGSQGGASSGPGKRGGGMFNSEYRKVREEMMLDVQRQYVEREVKKAREEKEREFVNMAKITRAWGGLGVKDAFYGWRKAARLNANTRVREEARLKREKFNAAQAPKAAIKLARAKMLQWGDPSVDVWSDELYWTHRRTGEVRWTKPKTEEFFPKGYKMPKEYEVRVGFTAPYPSSFFSSSFSSSSFVSPLLFRSWCLFSF
jgi:hypothetical protein